MKERTFALIKEGVVVNHIVADEEFIACIEKEYDIIVETTIGQVGISIGWVECEGVFTEPGGLDEQKLVYPEDVS